MIRLILMLLTVLVIYSLSMYAVMKRVIQWKYKALIYGGLTFLMLISVFLSFGYYEEYLKHASGLY
ncbi:membrane protein [Candidatus Magnetoovum chiemensis]|nr:membrane protein [Candidatus Magnetoovum chiemensis]